MAWRRFVLVGLLLAAAALCAWLGLGEPGGVPATDGAPDPATPLAGDARPALTSSTDAGADREQPVLIGRVAPDEPRGSGEAGLFGRVLDARDGSAVPGVAVLAEAHYTARVGEKTNRVEQVLGTAVSDARGAYRLRLAQGGIVRILAVGGGWVNAKAAEEAFEWRSDRAWRTQRKVGRWVSHDVHVLPTGRVVGRVLHEDGRPAAGTRLRPQRRRVDPATQPSAYPWFAVPDAVCGPDGSFVFDGLPRASDLLLEASLPGHPEAHAGPLDVVPGETTTAEIRLERRRIVRLHVVDAGTGEPIEAAAVRAWWTAPGCAPNDPMSSTNHPPVERHVATDVQGVALLLGPPAQALQVEVRAPDHLPFHSGPDAWNGLLRGLR